MLGKRNSKRLACRRQGAGGVVRPRRKDRQPGDSRRANVPPPFGTARASCNSKGAVSDSALIRELQYDTFGLEILHVDFARVSADERVHVKVPLEVRGQAAGVKEGGVVEHLIHEVEIECPVASIPDKVMINIATLKLDDSMTVGQATLPEGAKILSSATKSPCSA